jgi:hypothetical protein
MSFALQKDRREEKGMRDPKENKTEAKVLQFPGTNSERATIVAEEVKASKAALKKPMMTLASVVMMATAVNFFVSRSNDSASDMVAMNTHGVQSRSLASVGDAGRSLRDQRFEKDLAKKLSKLSSRDIASVGRAPSNEDRLRFGYLEGKYALRMNSGKISEIEFASSPDAPKYLNDRVEFLKSHKELMPVDFEVARNVSREVLPKSIQETYQLVQNDQVGAEVRFELDLYGRLISMKVESRIQ